MNPASSVLSAIKIGGLIFALSIGAPAETLTIATYNVENYTATDRMTEAGYRKDYPKPEAEKDALRTVIRALNADILVLQEMGTPAYLDELRRDLKSDGIDYAYGEILAGPDADRHLALLSRTKPKVVAPHPDVEISYFGTKDKVKRGVLEATFSTAAGDLTVFGVHLKSRFTDRPDDPQSAIRRGAEATAVRDLVLRRFPDPSTTAFVLLGDCNDSKDSKAMLHLLKRGKTTVMNLLTAIDSRSETWTHSYRKEDSYSRVDYVFVSTRLREAVIENRAKIYDGPAVGAASDHRPVVVQLELKAAPGK